jgi:lysophospholipase L1-like esterase
LQLEKAVMAKILVTLGDSWPQGGELKHDLGEVPYGNLLQNSMGFDTLYNYGSGGASNEDMLYQLQRFITESLVKRSAGDDITVICFLTNPARSAHWPRFGTWNEYDREWKHWPADAKEWARGLFMHFHRNEHEVMRSSATITTLQSWCKHHGFDYYYFSGWIRYPTWLPGVDIDKIWAQGKETAADWFGASGHNGEHLINVESNQYIRPNFAHPNQLGHNLIAEKLQAWIQSKQ